MNSKQKTVYYCEYCRTYRLQERAMKLHEQRCSRNPENKRPCFGCKFLENIKTEYKKPGPFELTESRSAKGFYCSKKQIELYPPILDHKGIEVSDDKEPMPRECEDFENLWE